MGDLDKEQISFCIRCGTSLIKWDDSKICPKCRLVHEPNNFQRFPSAVEFWELDEASYLREVIQPSKRENYES